MQISKDIHWVGSIDWELRNFHGYSTPQGSSYNAYLILDEKPTLIDTVKAAGFEEMISGIRKVIDPAKIQYIISNHTEMDHSGSIEEMLKLCPNAEVVCSPKGEEGLRKHFRKDWKFKVVKTGDKLRIGKRELEFFLTTMVHWPDSMATYSGKDATLFSNDAFGQHVAAKERFVDDADSEFIFKEAAKYYANIVLPYGVQVLKALEALGTLNLGTIAPSHGFIWRKDADIQRIISLYGKWARHETEAKAVIVYDTMWHSTETMAATLGEFLEGEGVPVKMMDLQTNHISDVITEVMFSKAVFLGSPILNNRMLPTMGAFLTYMKGLKPKNRVGLTFGSYGWSKGGFKELEEGLKDSGIELIGEGRYIQFIPSGEDLAGLRSIAQTAKKRLSK